MRILFTICGRAGSKGIKNKNIRAFLGRPLSYYTLSAIDLYLKDIADTGSDIMLNTDSSELAELMEHNPFNRKVQVVPREQELAGEQVSKIAVIRSCLSRAEEKERQYDMVIDLDLTSPLRTVADIRELIKVHSKGIYDVTFSVTEARRNPYFNMVQKKEEEFVERVIATRVTARQSAPEVYDMNASLYAYSPDFLKKDKEIFEGKCGMIHMMDTGILDLDHESDLEFMEVIARYIFEKYPSYRKIYENI